MASRDTEQPGAPRRGLEIGLAPTSGSSHDAVPGRAPSAEPSRRGRSAADECSAGEPSARAVPEFVHAVTESARVSVPAPSLLEGELEEVAVCELCGLVCRAPVPPVCPACGGGFG